MMSCARCGKAIVLEEDSFSRNHGLWVAFESVAFAWSCNGGRMHRPPEPLPNPPTCEAIEAWLAREEPNE